MRRQVVFSKQDPSLIATSEFLRSLWNIVRFKRLPRSLLSLGKGLEKASVRSFRNVSTPQHSRSPDSVADTCGSRRLLCNHPLTAESGGGRLHHQNETKRESAATRR